MSSSAPVLPSGLPLMPRDLGPSTRAGLVGLVALLHVGVGAMLMLSREPVAVDMSAPAIEVALITEEAPAIQAPQPPVPPAPPPRSPAPMTPAPPRSVAPPLPALKTPPVAAVAAPAKPSDMVVPPAPQESVRPIADPTAPPPAVSAASAATAMPTAAAPRPPATPKELPSSALRYLVEPPHVYPRVSRELGESGTVRLRLLIDEQGRLKSVSVIQSSGYPRLDQQALSAMRQARFQPLVENGLAREVTATTSIVFSLEDQ